MDWQSILVVAGAALLAGAGSYYFVLGQIPRRIMVRTMTALSQRGGTNGFMHGKRPTAKARMVVRPAPDLIYSSLVYDLSRGPLRLTGELPPGYWSLSLYADNSDNFFVLNDRQLPVRAFDVTLRLATQAEPGGRQAVVCPGRRGIALIRMFVPNDGALAAIEHAQQGFRTATLS